MKPNNSSITPFTELGDTIMNRNRKNPTNYAIDTENQQDKERKARLERKDDNMHEWD